jgi:hypothetical protein
MEPCEQQESSEFVLKRQTQETFCLAAIVCHCRPGFDPQQRQRIFLLVSASRPALGSIQPPVQWVPGGPFRGGKARPGRDADHSPLSSAEVKHLHAV